MFSAYTCNSASTTTPADPSTWEGLKVFDVHNPRKPELLTSVRTDCGSHTHTVLPEKQRLIVYLSSHDITVYKMSRPQTNQENCVAHNGNALPIKVATSSCSRGIRAACRWSTGPTASTRRSSPTSTAARSIRTASLGGFWSSYCYDGRIFGSEIQRGFDVFELLGRGFREAETVRTGTLNAADAVPAAQQRLTAP